MGYKKPNVTVDIAPFSIIEDQLSVLLCERQARPFEGALALPGGYVRCEDDDDLTEAAVRVLSARCGLDPRHLELVGTVGNGRRDPRGWAISVYYSAFYVDAPPPDRGAWTPVKLALAKLKDVFDHRLILENTLARLVARAGYTALPLVLLGPRFTLPQAQRAFELCLGTSLERKAFRRRLLDSKLLKEAGVDKGNRMRGPAPTLYRRVKNETASHLFPRTIG